MRVLFSFRSEEHKLPSDRILIETTNAIHLEFTKSPQRTFLKYKKWIQPMCQLKNGIFISINENSGPFQFQNEETDIKIKEIEVQHVAENFVRINFEWNKALPYRVDG